jgi:hypothetical protein
VIWAMAICLDLVHEEDGMECLVDVRCQVGESPVWDTPQRRLFWVDVLALVAFLLVAQEQSFTRAAAKLGVHNPRSVRRSRP